MNFEPLLLLDFTVILVSQGFAVFLHVQLLYALSRSSLKGSLSLFHSGHLL